MDTTIIFIQGKAQHGKDTSANAMTGWCNAHGKRSLTAHYGDYVKYIAGRYCGWNYVKDEAGRTLLQKLGTDIFRKTDPDFWVNAVANPLITLNEVNALPYDYIFIPDVRFPNETARHWRKMGLLQPNWRAYDMRVRRPDFDNGLTEEQKQHASETALDDYRCVTLTNTTLPDFNRLCWTFIDDIDHGVMRDLEV